MKLRFEDFEADRELRTGLEDFLAAVEAEGEFRNEVARIRRVCTVQVRRS